MVSPSWGLLNGGGFQNALAQGFQLGAQNRARREEEGRTNALAAYAANPEAEGAFDNLIKADPRMAVQMRAQQDQRTAQQAQQQRDLLPQLAKLADQATPENWMQVRQAAAQIGVDPSQLPEQFDQGWLDEQRFILKALGTPEGQAAASNAGKIAQDMGFQPGTPEYNAKVAEIWNAEQIKTVPYQAGGGVASVNIATGQVTPLVVPDYGSGAASGGIPPEAVAALRNGEGTAEQFDAIFGPGSAARIMGGGGGNATGGFPGN